CSIGAIRRWACSARTPLPVPAAASARRAESIPSRNNFARPPRHARYGSGCAMRRLVHVSTDATIDPRYTSLMQRLAWHSSSRRSFLRGTGALGLAAVARPSCAAQLIDICSAGTAQRLFVPSDRGYLGRLAPRGKSVTLIATRSGGLPRGIVHGPFAYRAVHEGRNYINPTLVLRRGERVQIHLINRLDEATITHWHGLAVDTRNDGSGMSLIGAGEAYGYDFEVRDRGSLYWYHPHPHGQTSQQVYNGLFGAIEVEDDDDAALRK